MGYDRHDISSDQPDHGPPVPKLRYDDAHPQPPPPMFIRTDSDPPDDSE